MIYRITYRVKTPIITVSPIHLDALLSAVHPAMHNIKAITRRSSRYEVITAPLPIDSARLGRDWVWCCTTADYSDDAIPYSDKITKRKTGIDYFYINGRQTPRTGTGRDRCDTIYGVVCSNVSFLASSSDKRELARICGRVKSIGALRRMGYGEVTEMEIEETNLSWKDCLVRDYRAMRAIPKNMLTHCKTQRVVVHPPYWLHERVEGVLPGDFAELRKDVTLSANR